MISKESDLPVTRQCELLKLNRSTVYYQPRPVSMEDQKLMRCIDERYLKRPFYGSRRMRDKACFSYGNHFASKKHIPERKYLVL